MLAHPWPGNIRELQNMILQAVVMSESDRLEVHDLALPQAVGAAAPHVVAALASRSVAAEPPAAPEGPPDTSPDAEPSSGVGGDGWSRLRAALDAEVRAAAAAQPRASLPLGRWLADDLVLAALDVAGGTRARAANRLGLPLTTFARRLAQAVAERPISTRPPTWTAVSEGLAEVLAAPQPALADAIEALLLDVVVIRVPGHLAYAASLLDLSTPTLKRRLAARADSRP